MSESEKCCLDIYMKIHVSELRLQAEYIRAAWLEGQKVYQQLQDAV